MSDEMDEVLGEWSHVVDGKPEPSGAAVVFGIVMLIIGLGVGYVWAKYVERK